MHRLVLLRHGESTWNKENRFTGWTDVDLTDKGREEARAAGRLLHEGGYTFDIAYTSLLKRAIRTLWMALDDMDLLWVPVEPYSRDHRPGAYREGVYERYCFGERPRERPLSTHSFHCSPQPERCGSDNVDEKFNKFSSAEKRVKKCCKKVPEVEKGAEQDHH